MLLAGTSLGQRSVGEIVSCSLMSRMRVHQTLASYLPPFLSSPCPTTYYLRRGARLVLATRLNVKAGSEHDSPHCNPPERSRQPRRPRNGREKEPPTAIMISIDLSSPFSLCLLTTLAIQRVAEVVFFLVLLLTHSEQFHLSPLPVAAPSEFCAMMLTIPIIPLSSWQPPDVQVRQVS